MQDVRVVPGVKMVRDGVTVGGVMQAQATSPDGAGRQHAAGRGAAGGSGRARPSSRPRWATRGWGRPTGSPRRCRRTPGRPTPRTTTLSRVAYPQAYPYNAFPFIGPYYPFPKVPLGWRKVTLEWEDGHWYLGRNSAPHDYWRVRFW